MPHFLYIPNMLNRKAVTLMFKAKKQTKKKLSCNAKRTTEREKFIIICD